MGMKNIRSEKQATSHVLQVGLNCNKSHRLTKNVHELMLLPKDRALQRWF